MNKWPEEIALAIGLCNVTSGKVPHNLRPVQGFLRIGNLDAPESSLHRATK